MKFLMGLTIFGALVVGGLLLRDHDESITRMKDRVNSYGERLSEIEEHVWESPAVPVERVPAELEHAKPMPLPVITLKKPVVKKPVVRKRKPIRLHSQPRPMAPQYLPFPFPGFL